MALLMVKTKGILRLLTDMNRPTSQITKSSVIVQLNVALDDLINIDVQAMAHQKVNSQSTGRRKNSDDDYYVEETLLFTYNPIQNALDSNQTSPQKKLQQTQPALSLEQLIQTVDELRHNLLIEVHQYDEDIEMDQDNDLLKLMMQSEYPDAEIDKLLETFSMSGQLKNNIANGELIDNDIRLSEQIRESIDEVKVMQRQANNKTADFEKRKFLNRYMDTAELLGVSLSVEHLLPALQEIFKQDEGTNSDKGFIKIIFQHLEKLIDFLSSSEITVGYNGIRDFIMPMFYDFFSSDKVDETLKQEIQNEVIELLVKVSKIMTNEDRAEKVLPIILESIRDDSDEEKRILGLELVDRLAEYLGKEVCQNFLMYEIVSLQDDPIYRVRKETVSRMVNISKVLGKDIFLHILFPVYKKLATDQIWGVRRSAVEMLPLISNLCPIEIKNGVLIEMFKKFSTDSSKWVKMATFQFLGPFIASYEGIEPNPLLVDYYINMCEQNKSSAPDNEVPYHCAFNFPAVLLTLGSKNWPKLSTLHEQLVRDSRWKVRRTLSFSLHEIAKILGPEVAEKELIPVLYHFLKDIPDVKEGASLNLPKFLKVLTPEQRESYVDKLAQTQIDTQDWRKRFQQAQQIRKFSKIFSSQTVYKYYVPLYFQLCQDQVAEVRHETSKAVKNIVLKLQDTPELFGEFVQKTLLFKQSNKFNLRQTFISMCQSMMECQDLFLSYFLKDFLDLQRDRIINVRMSLCEAIAEYWQKNSKGGMLMEIKQLRMMIKHLKRDVKDVSDILSNIVIEGDDNEEDEEDLSSINNQDSTIASIQSKVEELKESQIDPKQEEPISAEIKSEQEQPEEIKIEETIQQTQNELEINEEAKEIHIQDSSLSNKIETVSPLTLTQIETNPESSVHQESSDQTTSIQSQEEPSKQLSSEDVIKGILDTLITEITQMHDQILLVDVADGK